MQQLGWVLLSAAVILQLAAAQQHTVTYAGASEIDEVGVRRARTAGFASALAMAAASVAFYIAEALDGAFLVGVGIFMLAVIANETVRWASQRRHDSRRATGSHD